MDAKSIERFWSHVDKSPGHGPNGDCWVWCKKDGTVIKGYGNFTVFYEQWHPSRFSYFLETGEDPGSLLACHVCDYQPCVRPSHLFLGTAKDNMQDAKRKGRMSSGDNHYSRTHPNKMARGDKSGARVHPEKITRGEKLWSAKLTSASVRKMRRQYDSGKFTQKQLAEIYGITSGYVSGVINFKTWAHIDR